jgi:bacillithiol synthase
MPMLDVRDLPGFSPLIKDYVHRFDRLAPFYALDPRAPDIFRSHARRCDARSYPRPALRTMLRARHRAWAAPAPVFDRIDELCAADGLAVFTGQQTGLFGGPLYTLYKAITAIRVAATLQADLGRPVVPVFWLASEDHDLAEADHVVVPDTGGKPTEIRHARWGSAGYLPAHLRLGPGIHETLERLWSVLPESEFSPPLRQALAEAYAPDRTLADAFARWMLHLLGDTGLVLTDAADPELKRLAAPILERELELAPRTSGLILAASGELKALGYPAQIEARPDGVNCFLLRDGRRPLIRTPHEFRLRDTGAALSPAELLALCREAPEQFSPNVALRPVVQDALFPTLAYIAGPGELAYFAQLKGVYAAFEVPMPAILPRASLSVLEARMPRLLERFRLSLSDLTVEPEQLASRVLRSQLPPDLEATLTQARGQIEEIFRRVRDKVAAVDPTLSATVGQTSGHLKGHLDQLERKAVQALKRREADTRQQVQRLREALMPGGKFQERVYPTLPYLAKYGPAFVRVVQDAITGPGWAHALLSMSGESRSDAARVPGAVPDTESDPAQAPASRSAR